MSQTASRQKMPATALQQLASRAGASFGPAPGRFRSAGSLGVAEDLLRQLDAAAVTGPRLLDLWAWQEGSMHGLELLLGEGPELLWHSMPLAELAEYPALGQLLPSALALEAEIAASGCAHPISMSGHHAHDASLEAPPQPLTDASGPGLFTIPFGPVRSGVVESLLYDVATAGEDIVRVAVRPGLKRRAMERRLCELPLGFAPEVAERIAGVLSVSGAVAVCEAIEEAAGVAIPLEAAAVRACLVELERIFNHLDVVMKLCDDASLAVAVAQVGMLKERVLRLLAELTGHRYGRGIVTLGGVRHALDGVMLQRELPRLRRDLQRVRHQLLSTSSFLDRLQRTGGLTRDAASALGASGPVARGSGLAWDARFERPSPPYQDAKFTPAVMTDADVMARFEVRLAEVRDSLRLVERFADDGLLHAPPPIAVDPAPGASGVGCVESAEGEWIASVVVGEHGHLQRCRVRPASVLNFACFPVSCRGWVLTDFAFIEHSFGLSVAGRDR